MNTRLLAVVAAVCWTLGVLPEVTVAQQRGEPPRNGDNGDNSGNDEPQGPPGMRPDGGGGGPGGFRGGPGGFGPGGGGPGGGGFPPGGFGPGGFGPGGFGPGGDNQGSKNGKAAAAPAKPPRTPLTMKIPDKYRSYDKNGDNQIGLYEWPKNDYANFKKFDHNGDGFLTAKELAKGPRQPGGVVVAAKSGGSGPSVANTSASSGSQNRPRRERDGGNREGDKKSEGSTETAAAAPVADTPAKSPAEVAFKSLDKNNDGTLSAEEWEKSLLMRRRFQDAGVQVTFPVSRNSFLELYPQVFPNAGN